MNPSDQGPQERVPHVSPLRPELSQTDRSITPEASTVYDPSNEPPENFPLPVGAPARPSRVPRKLPLPGAAAIACLLLLESGATAFSLLPLLERRNAMAIPVALAAALLFAGGAGLLRQKRWGWSLALAAALITVCYATYLALVLRTAALLFPALLHMVFFLYLVRPIVRERMR